MKDGMRAKLIVLAAIALFLGQFLCVQTCAAQAAGTRNVPPCHRHHGSPASCDHGIDAVQARPQILPGWTSAIAASPLVDSRPAFVDRTDRPIEPSPPDSSWPLHLVLRI